MFKIPYRQQRKLWFEGLGLWATLALSAVYACCSITVLLLLFTLLSKIFPRVLWLRVPALSLKDTIVFVISFVLCACWDWQDKERKRRLQREGRDATMV